jgi:hypothetical protein
MLDSAIVTMVSNHNSGQLAPRLYLLVLNTFIVYSNNIFLPTQIKRCRNIRSLVLPNDNQFNSEMHWRIIFA